MGTMLNHRCYGPRFNRGGTQTRSSCYRSSKAGGPRPKPTHKTLAPGETLLVDTNSLVSWEDSVEFDVRTTGGCCTCCCAGEGLFNTKLTGPGEVFLQSYSHGKFKNYAIEWYLGNRASAGLARFASRGGAAADPFGAPPAADTEVIQRRGNNAPAPVPAAAPMDRKGR